MGMVLVNTLICMVEVSIFMDDSGVGEATMKEYITEI